MNFSSNPAGVHVMTVRYLQGQEGSACDDVGTCVGKVASKVLHRAMWTVAVALLLIGMFILLVHPRVFVTNTYMDVNSGDIRVVTTLRGVRIWDNVRTTPFSREVRRLGIAVPKDRVWRLARTSQTLLLGTHSHARLDRVRFDLKLLIHILVAENMPDQERLVIVESILESLKKKSPAGEIRDLIKAVEDRVYE